MKRKADIWKGHLKSEKYQNNTQNQEKHLNVKKSTWYFKRTPKIWKGHLKSEKDTQNLKRTPKIWKGVLFGQYVFYRKLSRNFI